MKAESNPEEEKRRKITIVFFEHSSMGLEEVRKVWKMQKEIQCEIGENIEEFIVMHRYIEFIGRVLSLLYLFPKPLSGHSEDIWKNAPILKRTLAYVMYYLSSEENFLEKIGDLAENPTKNHVVIYIPATKNMHETSFDEKLVKKLTNVLKRVFGEKNLEVHISRDEESREVALQPENLKTG